MSEKHERDIMREIQVALSVLDTRLFSMQSGEAWAGRIVERTPYSITLAPYYHVELSVPGMSDLVGWHAVTITPEMVGRRVAMYFACEVKSRRGKASGQQLRFIEAVRNAGGLAGIARTIPEARALTVLDPSTAKR